MTNHLASKDSSRLIARPGVGLALLLVLAGCSDASAPAAPHGPPNGIIDVDAGSIPLGDHGGSGGNAGANNAAGTAGHAAGAGGRATGSAGTGGSAGSSSVPAKGGVGAPCDASTDCNQSLTCHFDTTDYIADQQCTITCNSDDTCSTAFGKDSFCIGAQVCVHACTTDADCAAKTHCNDAGWCERGGPGSGIPYCAGVPTPCSLLSGSQCGSSTGCVDTSECSGVTASCYSQFDVYSCSSLQGCFWSSYSKTCSGSAEPCSLMAGSLTCASQRGCFWSGGCTGVPEACEKQFLSLCTNQPGCTLRTD